MKSEKLKKKKKKKKKSENLTTVSQSQMPFRAQ